MVVEGVDGGSVSLLGNFLHFFKSCQYLFKRITHDEYDTLLLEFNKEEADLQHELEGHSKGDTAFLLSCSSLLELANRAKELFVHSQPVQKNQLLRFVLANATVNGEKLLPELKTPFAGILLCNKNEDWLPILDSMRTDWLQEIKELGSALRNWNTYPDLLTSVTV